MSKYHRVELVRRAWRKEGPQSAARRAFQLARSALSGQHRLIFVLRAEDVRAEDVDLGDLELIRSKSIEQVPASYHDAAKAHPRLLWWDLEELLGRGAELWTGVREGSAGTIALTRPGDAVDAYFFPMTEHCLLISHCLTMPEHRGHGLYPRMLQHILTTCSGEGVERFYIDCSDYNDSSVQGILKAGFRLIGRGVHRRNGRLIWSQETPPCAARLNGKGTP